MPEATDYICARQMMVEQQLVARGIRHERVLDAMREVPREAFIAANLAEFAYHDSPLPIGEEQTISQPYVVALMLEAAAIAAQNKVLEIGAGSGYVAALLSRMARKVYAIERHSGLAKEATKRLQQLGYHNAEILCADGTAGLPVAAPFDAIIVSAGSPDIPETLKRQLAIGGRLVIPVGLSEHGQMLIRLTRQAEDAFESERLVPVSFVPLIGRYGWAAGREGSPDRGDI
ncbi:protein-L-isoaspartate(D-aspartate) O-methyltransferase [Bosea sp. CRIB-10]|uniref:protein-L-isoaspartate(D-aspartate) O-methyltransferase n=1 Tax=Bosea sp. CRIB-10 TaxID=378404 RepID=UPI0008F32C18|nr:protein-L-isoaspartate(D-aspartate) O-methyltransferase [Bosea sp. CRIB-10]SFB86880.1 protein-L-isoaspartate(D-aspartate) O-methyltransferase [Bosea sp. CRIB-10]